jgi:hypothetical protein
MRHYLSPRDYEAQHPPRCPPARLTLLVVGASRAELDREALAGCRRWLPAAAEWKDKSRVLGLEYSLATRSCACSRVQENGETATPRKE